MKELQKALGYSFRNEHLLRLALTHPSTHLPDNQRLEFLGDAVLEFCVSDMLYRKYPRWDEGKLTARRAALVSERPLSVLARSLDLGRCLRMNAGEEATGGRDKDSILSDAMEAVLAAVYEDGGIAAAAEVIRALFAEEERLSTVKGDNFKGDLQAFVQARGMETPVYEIIGRTGPDNDPSFTARVILADGTGAEGTGRSKQKAEQAAAREALCFLRKSETGCD